MLSVALATCEGERFILAQVRSILDQLGPGDEIVVSDDASRDGTLALIEALGDPRLRIFRNADRVGYVKNFERAIRHCRGEFIFFSDQDDVWMEGKVKIQRELLARVGCVVSDARVVAEDLSPINPSYFAVRQVRGFSPLDIFLRPPIVGATMACRRDFLERLLPFPERVPHDFWITLNAALSGQFEVLREPLLLYRRHGAAASLSASGRKRSLLTIAAERWAVLRGLWRQRRQS
jgi:glycosyltransferase involved in cell wall biosynthesis